MTTKLTKIFTGYLILIGVIQKEDDLSVELKDACELQFIPEAPNKMKVNLNKIDGLVVIKGSMTLIDVLEDEDIYKGYRQLMSGIVLPSDKNIKNIIQFPKKD